MVWNQERLSSHWQYQKRNSPFVHVVEGPQVERLGKAEEASLLKVMELWGVLRQEEWKLILRAVVTQIFEDNMKISIKFSSLSSSSPSPYRCTAFYI